MKSISITVSWDETVKRIAATAALSGFVASMPDKVVTRSTERPSGDPMAKAFENDFSKAINAALQNALNDVSGYETAAGVLDKARELLGLPADYGKFWIAHNSVGDAQLFWFADKETADAWLAAAIEQGREVYLLFTERLPATPQWLEPEVPTEPTEPTEPVDDDFEF